MTVKHFGNSIIENAKLTFHEQFYSDLQTICDGFVRFFNSIYVSYRMLSNINIDLYLSETEGVLIKPNNLFQRLLDMYFPINTSYLNTLFC